MHFKPEPDALRSFKDINFMHSSRSIKKPIRRPILRRGADRRHAYVTKPLAR